MRCDGDKVPDLPCTWEMTSMIRSYRDYEVPDVYLDMRSFGLFRLYSESSIVGNIRDLGINGQHVIFRPKTASTYAIPLARIADPTLTKHQMMSREMYADIESLISVTVEDVVLALEGFICSMAKDIGLELVTSKTKPRDLGLVA